MSKTKKATHKVCVRCDTRKAMVEYYQSYHVAFKDKKMPICKSCVEEIITEDDFKGFQAVMKLINKPILENLYKGDYKDYIRQVNSLPTYRLMTYDDSDLFNEQKNKWTQKDIELIELTEEELAELQYTWGKGYEEDEYIYLQHQMEDYKNRYEEDGKAFELLIIEICLTQLDIRRARANKMSTKDLSKTLQDLLGSAHLKPSQQTGASATEQETFGTLIKKYENERPIPEANEEWRDVDGIGKYIRTWFLGMMRESFGFKNQFEEEFEEERNAYTVYREVEKGEYDYE